MTYSMTDDPNDPCAYCVQWVESDDPDDVFQDKAIPMTPDGPATKLYQFVHDDCEDAVAAYVRETER